MAGEFRGCGKESNARHIVGECNCRVPDALAGEFRGCGKGSNARHIIGECYCRVLDACRDSYREKRSEVEISIAKYSEVEIEKSGQK